MGGAVIKAAVRRATGILPSSWRQRIRATGLRMGAARHVSPPGAAREAGAEVILDCALCGKPSTRHRIIGHVTSTQQGAFSVRDHRLILCEACQVIYLSPLPSLQDLKLMYENSTQFTDTCYTAGDRVQQIVGNLSRRFTRLGVFPVPGGACLEVGAGFAWASRACKQHDPRIVTVAQDVSSECAKRCPWVDRYHVGTVGLLPAGEHYQLVSLTHVIEHLLEPRRMLASLAGKLAPDGYLYVSAPYRPPLWRWEEGIAPWYAYSYLHVPAHISYLSRTWFETVCRETGLRLVAWDPSHDAHQVFEVLLQRA